MRIVLLLFTIDLSMLVFLNWYDQVEFNSLQEPTTNDKMLPQEFVEQDLTRATVKDTALAVLPLTPSFGHKAEIEDLVNLSVSAIEEDNMIAKVTDNVSAPEDESVQYEYYDPMIVEVSDILAPETGSDKMPINTEIPIHSDDNQHDIGPEAKRDE